MSQSQRCYSCSSLADQVQASFAGHDEQCHFRTLKNAGVDIGTLATMAFTGTNTLCRSMK